MNDSNEFKDSYHKHTGLIYQKNKIFSKAWFASKVFPHSFVEYLYRKMDGYALLLYKELWKNFDGCKNVLEIGSGSGRFLMTAPKNINLTGIEIINAQVAECKAKGFNVIQASIEKKTPFKDNSFDGIMIAHVIEHLEKPYEAMEEIKRLLKPQGKLIILTPNFSTDFRNFYDDPTHKTPFTKRGLFKMLNDCGFGDIQIKNDIYNSHSNLFTLFNIFPGFKIRLGKFIRSFYGKSIFATAKK